MTRRFILLPALGLIAALAIVAACSSDDPTAPPDDNDTTAPLVLGTDPDNGDIAVSVDDSVLVLFNEAMDPTTSSGAVTMSAGTISGSTWYTDRLLAVAHSDWPSGTQITVTVGTGLRDEAGNTLAAAHAFSFWTETSQLLLLASSPTDGATGVNRDATIELVFTRNINEAAIPAHISIADAVTKAVYPFTYSHVDEGHYLLNPDSTLPAGSPITVTVEAGLQSSDGQASLAQDASFTFTTGADVDTTPPVVIATFPADGLTGVEPDIGYAQLTFNEPVDPETFEPAGWNLEFYMVFMSGGVEPFWSDGNTVLTIPLPSNLPAGLPVEVRFVNFADMAGNVQTVSFLWNFTIAGTPDYVPVVDDQQYRDEISWAEGVGGTTDYEGTWTDYVRLEVQSGSDFRMVRYTDGSFTTPTGDWEGYTKTASALLWTGFNSSNKGLPGMHEKDNVFSSPLTVLPLPPSLRAWSGSTTVTVPGEGTYNAELEGVILGQENLPIPETGGAIYARNAWKVARTLTVELDGNPAFVQADTTWYAATLGELRTISRETEAGSGAWRWSDTWRIPQQP